MAPKPKLPPVKRVFHAADKFWEAWIEKATVYTRFGKTGAAGQTRLKESADPAAELAKQIAAKLKEGFVEAGAKAAPAKSGDPRNAQLEAAIVADPTDAEAYSVYADWLQGQGDPRGELIALQLAGKDKPAKALLVKHTAHFLGELVEHQHSRDTHGWDKKADREAFKWRFGFIHGARMSHNIYADGEWKGQMADVLKSLLAHPSGRFLVELTLMYNGDPSDGNLQSLLDVLAKRPVPTLRKLVIGDRVDQISWYHVGNLGKVWKALPNLREVAIEAGSFTLGTIDAPELTKAVFETGGLAKASAKSIAKIAAPKLAHLDVYFGDPEYGGEATAKDIAPLLARRDLPALRHLGLKNAMFADELCRMIPGAALLPQLRTLDLSLGTLSDEGAALLAAHPKAFAHLELLDLRENYLSRDGAKLVKGLAKKVDTSEQKQIEDDDPEWRYVSIGE